MQGLEDPEPGPEGQIALGQCLSHLHLLNLALEPQDCGLQVLLLLRPDLACGERSAAGRLPDHLWPCLSFCPHCPLE